MLQVFQRSVESERPGLKAGALSLRGGGNDHVRERNHSFERASTPPYSLKWPQLQMMGRSAFLVGVASSPSGRGQTLPLQAKGRAASMNYNRSTREVMGKQTPLATAL